MTLNSQTHTVTHSNTRTHAQLSNGAAALPMENGGSCLAAMHAHLFGQEKIEKRASTHTATHTGRRRERTREQRKRKAAAVSNE